MWLISTKVESVGAIIPRSGAGASKKGKKISQKQLVAVIFRFAQQTSSWNCLFSWTPARSGPRRYFAEIVAVFLKWKNRSVFCGRMLKWGWCCCA
jgi:hypothetical protein